MFVQTNTLKAVQRYIKSSLTPHFSESEVKQISFQLLEHCFAISRTDALLQSDRRFSETDLLKIRSAVKKIQAGEPLQYIVGSTNFCGLELKTDKRALIPRPETEELVQELASRLKTTQIDRPRVMDLCTGSGCIALGLNYLFPTCEVQGMDFSGDAIQLAIENAEKTNLDVSFFQADVFSEAFASYVATSEKWNAWVANPPYIPYKDKVEMAINVLEYEPHLALFVTDESPLVFYNKISELAQKGLRKRALLAFEIHENYASEVVSILESHHFHNIEVLKDLQGKNRMVLAENS